MKKNRIIYNSINILFLARVSLSTFGFAQDQNTYLNFKNQSYQLKNLDVNTNLHEYAAHYYSNNKVLYSATSKLVVNRNKQKVPYVQLFLGDISSDGTIINSTPFVLDLNSPLHEAYFAFTKDGKHVYFTTGDQNMGKGLIYSMHLQLYGADIINNSIKNITLLDINETVASTAYPFLADDDKTLYFTSNRYGGYGGMDLYKVNVLGPNEFGEIENLGPQINSSYNDTFPFIDKNGILYFSSDRVGGFGGLDVYGVLLKSEKKEVVHLPSPLNSKFNDFGFVISNRHGFVSSNRKSGKGSEDIYAVTLNSLCAVSGVVTNKQKNKPMSYVDVMVTKNNKIIDTLKTDSIGKFQYNLSVSSQDQYGFKALQNNFTSDSLIVSNLNEPYLQKEISLKLSREFNKNHLGYEILDIDPVYFDLGAWNINNNAAVVLDEVVKFLKEYPNIVIEIDSHTDSRGNKINNKLLSEKRAKSTLDYLVSHGIISNRLTYKGFGESLPVNHCKDGVKCSKKEYQLNRRTEFVIVKK